MFKEVLILFDSFFPTAAHGLWYYCESRETSSQNIWTNILFLSLGNSGNYFHFFCLLFSFTSKILDIQNTQDSSFHLCLSRYQATFLLLSVSLAMFKFSSHLFFWMRHAKAHKTSWARVRRSYHAPHQPEEEYTPVWALLQPALHSPLYAPPLG